MRIIYKSIAIGCAIEVAAASLFAMGGFGPCGPNNPAGMIGVLLHIFPGVFIAEGINAFVKLPDWLMTPVVILSQAAFWSAIADLIIRRSGRLKFDTDAAESSK